MRWRRLKNTTLVRENVNCVDCRKARKGNQVRRITEWGTMEAKTKFSAWSLDCYLLLAKRAHFFEIDFESGRGRERYTDKERSEGDSVKSHDMFFLITVHTGDDGQEALYMTCACVSVAAWSLSSYGERGLWRGHF